MFETPKMTFMRKTIVAINLNTNHLPTHPQQRIEESLNLTDHNEIIVTSFRARRKRGRSENTVKRKEALLYKLMAR